MENVIDWPRDEQILSDIVMYELEIRAVKVCDVVCRSGKEVVQADDPKIAFQKILTQVGAYKAPTTGNADDFIFNHNESPGVLGFGPAGCGPHYPAL